MTADKTNSNSRPTTPVPLPVLVDEKSNNLTYLHDLQTPPITPVNRTIPLMFADCPPAPRPRKRIFRLENLQDVPPTADIFLPRSSQLIGDDNESPPPLPLMVLGSESPLPPHNIQAPKPNKRSRRVVCNTTNNRRSSVGGRRIRPLPKIQTDVFSLEDKNENHNNDNSKDKVRINFRRSFNISDLSKSTSHMDTAIKLWPVEADLEGAAGGNTRASILKRRNSYNALCA